MPEAWVVWLNMGGHGWYVWPAYGLAIVGITVNVWRLRRQRRQLVARIRQSAGPDSEPR